LATESFLKGLLAPFCLWLGTDDKLKVDWNYLGNSLK
jgi:hypothetical protein